MLYRLGIHICSSLVVTLVFFYPFTVIWNWQPLSFMSPLTHGQVFLILFTYCLVCTSIPEEKEEK